MLNYVSKCVKLNKIVFKSETIFDFGVKFDIWGFGYFSRYFGIERSSQYQNDMFPTKCQVQNDCTNQQKNYAFSKDSTL